MSATTDTEEVCVSVAVSGKPARRLLAGHVSSFAPGTSVTVEGGDVPVAVFRLDDGSFHATTDTCTHEQWSLGSDGELEGRIVTCPLHMAAFDVESGRPLCLPATVALRTFHVDVVGDEVYVAC